MSKKQEVIRREDGTYENSGNPDKQWKKGESGNPNGRRNAYTDLIKEYSFSEVNDRERREIIVSRLFSLAERGDLRAIQFIIERLEGRALERQERTTKTEPIQVLVIND